jgi:microcystin-dependent protein
MKEGSRAYGKNTHQFRIGSRIQVRSNQIRKGGCIMAEPFLSEIRIMSFVFAPKGWALCNGQLLPINQNQGLFSLLGTTFGGDGRVNFALPDLRGRAPIHVGGGHTLGGRGGEQAHTLSIAELPQHQHVMNATANNGSSQTAEANVLGAVAGRIYTDPSSLTSLSPSSVTNVGGSQAHLNMQPFLTLSFCIALQGLFPSPN